ncbi:MAG: hypothetical protein ACR9NN_19370 [Nostochopsis sp.]
MKTQRFEDTREFYGKVKDYLLSQEAMHNVQFWYYTKIMQVFSYFFLNTDSHRYSASHLNGVQIYLCWCASVVDFSFMYLTQLQTAINTNNLSVCIANLIFTIVVI